MPSTDRPIPRILAEIAEVRRHLHDAPPHHDGGTRALRDRLTALETELIRARQAAPSGVTRPGDAGAGPASGVAGPGPTPR